MTEPPRDSQDPQYPRHPDEPAGQAAAPNPRPIRASRVWMGIGLAFLGHILAMAIVIALAASGFGAQPGDLGLLFLFPELLLFVASLVFGIMQLARGDRGIGVGLLVGWGTGTVICGGTCVALIVSLSRSLG